jgi:hypothetical protein
MQLPIELRGMIYRYVQYLLALRLDNLQSRRRRQNIEQHDRFNGSKTSPLLCVSKQAPKHIAGVISGIDRCMPNLSRTSHEVPTGGGPWLTVRPLGTLSASGNAY